MKTLAAWLVLASFTLTFAADQTFIFSFFRGNGEDGLYLASSTDGLKWTPLNGDMPLLKPEVGESKLMRDPSIARGPDGTFHMVWTTSWNGRTIGYASSKDLRHWSAQRAIELFPAGMEVLNCWAPELFYDSKSKDFAIVWASTIKGKFPETLGKGTRDYNHRLYVTHTRDFAAFTPAQVIYDPGFQVIDGAMFREGGKVHMIVKNETQNPPAKYLFVTSADRVDGPWTKAGESISGPQWAEGPAPLKVGSYWLVLFDRYRDKAWGVIRSKDLRTWEDVTPQLSMPAGARHGTALAVPAKIVQALKNGAPK